MLKNKMNERSVGAKEIITGFLAMAAAILLVIILFSLGKPRNSLNPIDDMQFNLKRGEYHRIFQDVQNFRRRGIKENSESKKYEAIGDYYRYALEYNMHITAGDGKEEICLSKMEEAKEAMKDLDFAASDIDALLLR